MKTRFALLCLSFSILLSTTACTKLNPPISNMETNLESDVESDAATDAAERDKSSIEEIVQNAKRIPNTTGWFEVLRLPNRVYAFWEPGHVEKVNSYLILGSERDLLYDTGMGIANIRQAIQDVRALEKLPQHNIMVVNSHNHLDHNGGNQEFDAIWTVNEPWALKRLASGVPAGEASGFVPYWSELTPHEGVEPPPGFSPETHAIQPYALGQVNFLQDEQAIDLGDRSFRVIRTFSHSPDGIALYSAESALFFGGDTFYGANYLVTDLNLLATD
jgi:glyoxylase-like metal-dependent hydrolase (beta-lactamase superfamily II)